MDKQSVISRMVEKGNKKFGEGTLISLGGVGEKIRLKSAIRKVVSTGAPNLDIICARNKKGEYGLPFGRVIFITGQHSSGKTTLALEIAAEAQRKHEAIVYFIDQEHTLDLEYAAKIGVDVKDMIISQPQTTEQSVEIVGNALDVLEDVAEGSGGGIPLVLIIWDTFSASPTTREFEEKKTSGMGEHARISSSMFRQLSGRIAELRCMLIVNNQERHKIKQGWAARFPEKTFLGANPQEFHASIGFELRKIGKIKSKKKKITGITTIIKTIKNKCSPPFREAVVNIYFGKGIDSVEALWEALQEKDLVEKRKGSFVVGDHSFKDFHEYCNDKLYDEFVKLLSKKQKKKDRYAESL